MNTETTYNPVAQPGLREKLSDIYYGSAAGQFGVEAAFFIAGCAGITAFVVAVTA